MTICLLLGVMWKKRWRFPRGSWSWKDFNPLTVDGSSSGISISACLRKTFPLEMRHSILSKAGTLSRLMTPATNPRRPLLAAWASSGMSALWAESIPLDSSWSVKNVCVFSNTCLSSVSSRKLDFKWTALSLSSLISPSVFSRWACPKRPRSNRCTTRVVNAFESHSSNVSSVNLRAYVSAQSTYLHYLWRTSKSMISLGLGALGSSETSGMLTESFLTSDSM